MVECCLRMLPLAVLDLRPAWESDESSHAALDNVRHADAIIEDFDNFTDDGGLGVARGVQCCQACICLRCGDGREQPPCRLLQISRTYTHTYQRESAWH